MPKQIDLPAVVNTDAITIAQFKSDPGTLDCSLLSGAADVPDSALYFTETIEGSSGAWYLSFTPDDKATPPEVIKIAHLVASSQELTFRWAKTTGIESIKNQLRNCLLRVRVGQGEQTIQLRNVHATAALKLNLDEDETVLTFDVFDFPKADAVYVELDPPGAGTFVSDASRVAIGKDIVFQFSELAGAQFTAETLRKKGTNTLVLRLSPEFKEPRGVTFELTRPKLEAMKKRWTEAGQKASATLAADQKSLDALKSQRSSLASRSAVGAAAQTAKAKALLGLDRELKRLSDRIPSQKSRVAEMSARLAAAPRVETFLNTHHNRTDIRFRIFAQVGEQRLILVESGQ